MSRISLRKIKSEIVIKNIKVQNFKSFKKLDVSLDDLTVVIGANASGKSNFVQVFSFLRDIVVHGLDNAISRQGGMKYLHNFADPNAPISYEITFQVSDVHNSFIPIWRLRSINSKITKIVYKFEIQPKSNSDFKITMDEWCVHFTLLTDFKSNNKSYSSTIIIKKEQDRIKVKMDDAPAGPFHDAIKKHRDRINDFTTHDIFNAKSLSIENDIISRYYLRGIGAFCDEFKIYDFDLNLVKAPTPIMGMAELEPDGVNLPIILKSIMNDSQKRQKFLNLIKNILPFVNSIGTETLLDSSIMLTQKESYFPDQFLPAILVSNGTINIITLVTALYFQDNPMIIIEEPERNVHPSLVSKIADMLNDAARNKRLIVTTHSPELIRHVNIENIVLIGRNGTGSSEIIRPGDQDMVKEFLKNEMDIGDLYTQNLLDV